jgi:AcrR family transcriptional regulator
VEVILEATAQVLVERGFEGASTNRIARRAGVSIGSLYQYFPNKEALVSALIERHLAESVALLPRELKETADLPLRAAVRLAIDFGIAAHRANPELHQVLTEQIPRLLAREAQTQWTRTLHALVHDYLERHRAEVRPRNLRIAAFLLAQAVEAATHGAVVHYPEYLVGDELADELVELALRYLEE